MSCLDLLDEKDKELIIGNKPLPNDNNVVYIFINRKLKNT
jgi:hypothetical protein